MRRPVLIFKFGHGVPSREDYEKLASNIKTPNGIEEQIMRNKLKQQYGI